VGGKKSAVKKELTTNELEKSYTAVENQKDPVKAEKTAKETNKKTEQLNKETYNELEGIKKGKNATFEKSSLGGAAKRGNLVKIGTVEGDVMMFSSKIGKETVEGITNFAIKDGKLYLNQLHLQGSSAGNVGREALWNIAKDLGKQYNVKEVIIQGGKRTTGKYKGTVPSPITIKVN